MHKFRHYDGIAYVSASLSRELVSIEKTVLMNYGTDRSEVICRTYVRKTLISEKVAYNLEDAKQVLDCAESLHPCRGAGRAKDFTYDVLTKKLEQQISHSDGLVFSVTCKGAVKQQGSSCISCKPTGTPKNKGADVRCWPAAYTRESGVRSGSRPASAVCLGLWIRSASFVMRLRRIGLTGALSRETGSHERVRSQRPS
ncbi:hypothetical protein MRX96_024708 [Rhipicephalus microplus]